VLGIEKGIEFVAAARTERPRLIFERLDVLAAPQYLVQLTRGADFVAVDINGAHPVLTAPSARLPD